MDDSCSFSHLYEGEMCTYMHREMRKHDTPYTIWDTELGNYVYY